MNNNTTTNIFEDHMVIHCDRYMLNVYYVGSYSKWAKNRKYDKVVISYTWLGPIGSYTIEHFVDESRRCFNADGLRQQ